MSEMLVMKRWVLMQQKIPLNNMEEINKLIDAWMLKKTCLIIELALFDGSFNEIKIAIEKFLGSIDFKEENEFSICLVKGLFSVLVMGSKKAMTPGLEYLRKNHADKEEQLNAQK